MSSEGMVVEGGSGKGLSPMAMYGLLVFATAVLKFLAGLMVVPPALAMPLTLVSALVFMGLPIWALISGSRSDWKPARAWIFVGLGAAVHGGIILYFRMGQANGGHIAPAMLVALQALKDTAVLVWTMGLGALVAMLIKEKNLLPPVALFLAGFDAFLILTPMTPQAQIVAQNPGIVKDLGMTVPQMRANTPESQAEGARILDLGYVGPADLFVTAALFVVLARHRMRFGQSAMILISVLFGYMILAVVSPIAGLPALVPIGVTVLLVNMREFKMTKEERTATWGVAVIALMLAGFGLYKRVTYKPPTSPTEPLQQEVGPALPGPGGTPLQANPGQSPS